MSELSQSVENLVEEEDRKPFEVMTDMEAEDALQKIREKKAELKIWKDHYNKKYKDTEATIMNDIVWIEAGLKAFFLQQQAEGMTRKTKSYSAIYDLPSGKLSMKKQEPTYDLDDEKLIPWLEANAPEFVKVEKSAKWGDFKKTLLVQGDSMITEFGEVVPGVTAVAREDIFKVEEK